MEVLERKIKLIPLEEIEPFIKIAEKTCPDKNSGVRSGTPVYHHGSRRSG